MFITGVFTNPENVIPTLMNICYTFRVKILSVYIFLNKCESMHTAMNIPIVLSDSQFRHRINKRDGVKRGE